MKQIPMQVRKRSDFMSKARSITNMAMLFAVAVVLSFLEGLLPPVPYLPPGFKLGLSNIATMYALFFMGKSRAFLLAFLKSMFVLVTRGGMSGILSLSGGLVAICVMIILSNIFKDKISYLLLSVFGGIFHNLGQLAVVTLIMYNSYTLWYTPVLLVAGVIMGSITGSVLKVIMPVFNGIYGGK